MPGDIGSRSGSDLFRLLDPRFAGSVSPPSQRRSHNVGTPSRHTKGNPSHPPVGTISDRRVL
jgi:hypothetical protein